MRICTEKSTGKLIEMQSHATEGTLIQNAVNAGYAASDVEEKEVAEAEYVALMAAQPKPKSELLAAINAQTAAAITGGFVSSASGAPYRYDSDENDQKNITLMQTVSHSPRFADHPVYQGAIPIRAIPEGGAEKETLYLTADQMDLLVEDLALHIGQCKMAGWAAQAEVE